MTQRTGNAGGYRKIGLMMHAMAGLALAEAAGVERPAPKVRKSIATKLTYDAKGRYIQFGQRRFRQRNGMLRKNIGGDRLLWRH